jgi:aspartate 1-decarboxylase
MKRIMLKSKIHMATVTEANLEYHGSISICPELYRKADMLPFEKVEIYNCNNGQRFATYVIEGGKGEICLNGAAARLVAPKDKVIIASYAEYEDEEAKQLKPILVFAGANNEISEIKNS